jgi:hypothetical protein
MGISGVPFFIIYKGGTKDTDEPITLSGAQVCVVCVTEKGCGEGGACTRRERNNY